MSNRIVVSDELWIDVTTTEVDALFKIEDNVGGAVIVGEDEIEPLIHALQLVKLRYENGD